MNNNLEISCVNCNSIMVKNGKTIVGSQKYLCKQCGCRCTPNKKRYDTTFKLRVLDSLHSGLSPSAVAKEFGIDNKTVVAWSRDKAIVDLFGQL
ncbi:MAG: hypothetical protein LBK70_02510 [Clostridiales bacterium]|jgi:transposase-like protein|nr:hypothetical protein [Clostridiales bacterium]